MENRYEIDLIINGKTVVAQYDIIGEIVLYYEGREYVATADVVRPARLAKDTLLDVLNGRVSD